MDSSDKNPDNSVNVQCVNKKCSDELLRKFSDSGDEGDGRPDLVRAPKRRKRSSRPQVVPGEPCDSPTHGGGSGGGGLVERRSLLPAPARRRSVLLRRLGIGRSSQIRTRNRSLLGTIEMTWRKTVEGASRVFMEKHYNRHRRLISDSAV